jgi:hypothetical protein
MKPTQLHPCSICRSATTSQEQLKALTGKGIALCRGPRPAPPESGCDLRKISWDCIDAFNAHLKSAYSSPYRSGDADLSKKYTITAADPQLYLSAWNGPKEEGREWFDVDQLYLQYRWSGGGFSDVMIFDVYALPGMYSITLTIRISISECIEIFYPQYEVVLDLRISR